MSWSLALSTFQAVLAARLWQARAVLVVLTGGCLRAETYRPEMVGVQEQAKVHSLIEVVGQKQAEVVMERSHVLGEEVNTGRRTGTRLFCR